MTTDTTTATPRSVAFAIQKGGTGKTTICLNTADALARRGHDVLVIDLDQQGHATAGLGEGDRRNDVQHIGHALREKIDVEDLIAETDHGIDLIPANEDLDMVANFLLNHSRGRLLLRDMVVDPLLRESLGDDTGRYDYVLIDAPPSLGTLSDSALFAAGHVMVPLRMADASVDGFLNMKAQQISEIEKARDFSVLALVPNVVENVNNTERIIAEIEGSPMSDLLPRFARSSEFDNPDSPGPGIRKRVKLSEAWGAGEPLSTYHPESDMLDRFDELAEIVERGSVAPAPSTEPQTAAADN